MTNFFRQSGYLYRLYFSRILLAVLLVGIHTASRAADNNQQELEKIFISADHMQFDIISGRSVYSGNVKISQGELVLTGDKVILDQNNEKVERLTVTGKPVHYSHVTEKGESIDAESEQMVYIASQNKLVMTINAKLLQPDHLVSSEKITYDTKKKIVMAGDKPASPGKKVDEKQRVNITLTPKKAP